LPEGNTDHYSIIKLYYVKLITAVDSIRIGVSSFERARAYAYLAIARPSVCPSVTGVYHTKTAEVRITKFSPYGSPIPFVFVGWVSSRNSKGFPERGRQTRMGVGKIGHFI